MAEYLVNVVIWRKSLIIEAAKFLSELSHYDKFLELSSHHSWNCPEDHRHARDLTMLIFFTGEVFLYF